MWNEDEVKGKAEQVKGAAKEKLGKAVGNEDLEAEGVADQAEGQIQEGAGTARRKVEEAVDEVKKRVNP